MKDHSFGHDGDWPLNTHGGQLGFGQADLAGGMSHIIEAVRQLRHEATPRQIPNAELALVTGNGATLSEAAASSIGGGIMSVKFENLVVPGPDDYIRFKTILGCSSTK